MAGYDCPPAYYYVASTTQCESGYMFYTPITRKSGAYTPAAISSDYRQAVCDVARILHPGWLEAQAMSSSVTLFYDDGSVNFDCRNEPDNQPRSPQ